MPLLRRLLLITFVESFACILVERGIYFYGTYKLGFTDLDNLWLAFAFGLAYVAGAMTSHASTARFGEKKLLALSFIGQVVLHVTLAICPTRLVVYIASTLIGCLNGLKWPVIESYVSAGQTPSATARAVGLFNISWAVAVPPSIVVVGPLIDLHNSSLFVLAAILNVVSLWLLLPVSRRPAHLPADHPDRPTEAHLARIGRMLGFSRWSMFFSYAALFAAAALMPGIMKGFGLPASAATPLSSIIDFMRLTAFVLLMPTTRWHFKWWPLVVAMVCVPAGFVLIVVGSNVSVVVTGEVVFGLAAGMTYYAALYYAMIVQNASVGAGGTHESLIGLGFAAGPLACLAGAVLTQQFGGPQSTGLLIGISPLLVLCAGGAVRRAMRIISKGG